MDYGPWIIVLSWPDVPQNFLETEYQSFTKYFNILDEIEVVDQIAHCIEEDVKTRNGANKFRTQGNQCYKNFEYKEALRLYNCSISQAPRNSIEFVLAVANRSAVLFDLAKYKECLEDINLVLESRYPEDLLYKIYLRQGNCYLKLNLKSEAIASIQKARESVDKLNLDKLKISSIHNRMMELKNQIKEQLETNIGDNKPVDYLFTEPVINLKGGENPKFINAAKVVNIQYSRQLGRHVVANTDIKKGDILFVEEPYSFVKFDKENRLEIHFTVCCNCLKRSLNCIPCILCPSFFYCSDKCRQESWESGHRWECLAYRYKIITVPTHQLCLATLFKASRDGFKTAIGDDSVYGNKDNNYPFVNKLITHKSDVCGLYVQAAVWMTVYLKNFTDYFQWLLIQPNRPAGSEEDLFKFVGGLLVKYQLQSRCNAIYMLELKEGKLHCPSKQISRLEIAYGIYVSTSLLNHSCLPNTVHSFHKTTRIVRALQDIKKGKEITINYLNDKCDFYGPEKCEGLQPELDRFSFKCSCRACSEPGYQYLYLPLVCPRCGGKSCPLSNDEEKAKCRECFLVFDTTAHCAKKSFIGDIFDQVDLVNNTCEEEKELLRDLYKLLRKTYHKHSVAFYKYYDCCLNYYGKTGEVTKCIETVKLSLEVSKLICGVTSEEYLASLLTLAYCLATYCIILRKQKAANYKLYYDKTLAVIKETVNISHYFFSPTVIKDYVANITKYLNSDKEKIIGCVLEGCSGHKQNSAKFLEVGTAP